jgi:hypothetical protein
VTERDEALSGVYAIRAHGLPFVKIGYSKNARKRLSEIQTGCPARVFLHAYLPGATETDEKTLHRKLNPWKTSGEWFAWADPVRAEVQRFVRVKDDRHTDECEQEARMLVETRGEIVELRAKMAEAREAVQEASALLVQIQDDAYGRHPWTARKELAKLLREVDLCNWQAFRAMIKRDDPEKAADNLFRMHESFAKSISQKAGEHFDAVDVLWRKLTQQTQKTWEVLK